MDTHGDMMDTHRNMMDTHTHSMLLGLAEDDAAYSVPDFLDPNYTDGDAPTARTCPSTCSRSGEVTELEAQEVRWFYREDKRNWKPFVGHDSLKIELSYRALCALRDVREGVFEPEDGVCEGRSVCEDAGVEAVCVRGGLYEVDVKETECYPVYWNQQERIPVMRAQWFTDGTWLPLDEEDGDLIEVEHLTKFRGHRIEDSIETEGVITAPESKEGLSIMSDPVVTVIFSSGPKTDPCGSPQRVWRTHHYINKLKAISQIRPEPGESCSLHSNNVLQSSKQEMMINGVKSCTEVEQNK